MVIKYHIGLLIDRLYKDNDKDNIKRKWGNEIEKILIIEQVYLDWIGIFFEILLILWSDREVESEPFCCKLGDITEAQER